MSRENGAILLTGVNCVGKSTLARELAAEFPGTTAVHASEELREYFGNIDRDTQDRISVDEHRAGIASHLVSVIKERLASYVHVIYDTQLVALKPGPGLQFEYTWSDEYSPYISKAFMLAARPSDILRWRKEDALSGGRERIVDEDAIGRHQDTNLSAWRELVARGALPLDSQILSNSEGGLALVKHSIKTAILAPTSRVHKGAKET
jgi:adenylate kinase